MTGVARGAEAAACRVPTHVVLEAPSPATLRALAAQVNARAPGSVTDVRHLKVGAKVLEDWCPNCGGHLPIEEAQAVIAVWWRDAVRAR